MNKSPSIPASTKYETVSRRTLPMAEVCTPNRTEMVSLYVMTVCASQQNRHCKRVNWHYSAQQCHSWLAPSVPSDFTGNYSEQSAVFNRHYRGATTAALQHTQTTYQRHWFGSSLVWKPPRQAVLHWPKQGTVPLSWHACHVFVNALRPLFSSVIHI